MSRTTVPLEVKNNYFAWTIWSKHLALTLIIPFKNNHWIYFSTLLLFSCDISLQPLSHSLNTRCCEDKVDAHPFSDTLSTVAVTPLHLWIEYILKTRFASILLIFGGIMLYSYFLVTGNRTVNSALDEERDDDGLWWHWLKRSLKVTDATASSKEAICLFLWNTSRRPGLR